MTHTIKLWYLLIVMVIGVKQWKKQNKNKRKKIQINKKHYQICHVHAAL